MNKLQQLGFNKVNECFGYENIYTNAEYYLLQRGTREFLMILGKDKGGDYVSFFSFKNALQTDHFDFSNLEDAVYYFKNAF
jgi:hypothetical protein